MKTHCLIAIFALALSQSAAAAGDPKAGAMIFKKCAACHTASEPVSRVGPSLMGIVGRPVATFPGYSYSAPMAALGATGAVWDEALLAKYLPSPAFMVPGTKMTFAGLRKPADVANIIAYLKDPAAAR